MPVLLDMGESDSEDEMVAIGTGQFRRKSTVAREEVGEFLDEEEEELGDELVGSKRRRGE